MTKQVTSFSFRPTDLTLSNGIYFSDPSKIPFDGARFYIENPVSSPVPLARVYPLSDGELAGLTSSGSASWYQSKWAAGIPWRLPLGWMGGAYPYDFVLDGPVGAEVIYVGRDTLVPPFYEYIEWLNPTIGTHEFTLTCIDQEDNSTTSITFTLVVYDENNTTHIGWVNPGHASASDSNNGSRTAPWLTINGWYGSSLSSSTHRTKVIFYEDVGANSGSGFNLGGVTGVSYDGSSNQRVRLNDNKPKVHHAVSAIGVHGNGAYWQLDGGAGWSFSGPFNHDGANVPEGGGTNTRTQYFRAGNAAYKYGFIGMGYTFGGADVTPSSGSNSSAIELSTTLAGAPSTFSNYFYPNIVLDGASHISGLKNNNAMDCLCVGWEVRNCINVTLFHHKSGEIRRTEERGCIAVENNTGDNKFRSVEWINDPIIRSHNHYCWNNYKFSHATSGAGTEWNGGGADNYEHQRGWRNNERINYHLSDANSGTTTLTRNVRFHSGVYTNGINDTSGMTFSAGSGNNEYITTTSGDLDATTNLLTGAARTAQLGLAGCEMTEA